MFYSLNLILSIIVSFLTERVIKTTSIICKTTSTADIINTAPKGNWYLCTPRIPYFSASLYTGYDNSAPPAIVTKSAPRI